MEFVLKNMDFLKGMIVGYKNGSQSNKELKFKKIFQVIIVKIYLGISVELLWAVWDQFSVRQSIVSTCTCSQGLQLPLKGTESALTEGF